NLTLGGFACFCFGDDPGCDHLRDERVGFDGGRDAGGQVEVGEAELVADVEAGDVHLDRARDVLGSGLDGQPEHDLLEQAAVADPFGLADQVQGNLGADRDVGADPHEVDVDQVAAGRVALNLAGQGELVVPGETEADQRVRAVGEDVAELTGRDGHGHRVAAEAVDDSGDLPGATEPTRGA